MGGEGGLELVAVLLGGGMAGLELSVLELVRGALLVQLL